MGTREGPWGLADELEFIAGLGKHTMVRRDHADAVLDYTNALRKRWDWGAIDKAKVYAALQRELAKA